jgi:hypothetical protein
MTTYSIVSSPGTFNTFWVANIVNYIFKNHSEEFLKILLKYSTKVSFDLIVTLTLKVTLFLSSKILKENFQDF